MSPSAVSAVSAVPAVPTVSAPYPLPNNVLRNDISPNDARKFMPNVVTSILCHCNQTFDNIHNIHNNNTIINNNGHNTNNTNNGYIVKNSYDINNGYGPSHGPNRSLKVQTMRFNPYIKPQNGFNNNGYNPSQHNHTFQ